MNIVYIFRILKYVGTCTLIEKRDSKGTDYQSNNVIIRFQ